MITIQPMSLEDVQGVMIVEKACFGEGWTSTPFEKEIERPDCYYFVAKDGDTVIGYSGGWLIVEELHVIIMGVKPTYRKHKIGQRLLINLLRAGIMNGAKWSTLEVKANNTPAQKMYEKFRYTVKGRRKQYYQQDKQDALIMWTEEIDTNEYNIHLDNIEKEVTEQR